MQRSVGLRRSQHQGWTDCRCKATYAVPCSARIFFSFLSCRTTSFGWPASDAGVYWGRNDLISLIALCVGTWKEWCYRCHGYDLVDLQSCACVLNLEVFHFPEL